MTRTKRRESIELLTTAFVDRLTSLVEHEIGSRARALAADWIESALRTRAAPPESAGEPTPWERGAGAMPRDVSSRPLDEAPLPGPENRRPAMAGLLRERAPRRINAVATAPRGRAVPPPSDPGQEERDFELSRLRRLLRPAQHEGVAAPVSSPVPGPTTRVESPHEPLRVLELEIRAQVDALPRLPPPQCTARLASWAGRIRSYGDANRNPVAAQLLLDKVRALAFAMEVGRVEALSPSWRAVDWAAYIRENEAVAESAPAAQVEAPAAERPASPADDENYDATWS